MLNIRTDLTKREYLMYTVQFSHRSVKDFLSQPAMLRKLNEWMSKDIDPSDILCKTTLAIIKSLPSSFFKRLGADPVWWCFLISSFLSYAHRLEQDQRTPDTALTDELQHVVAVYTSPYRDEQHSLFNRYLSFSDWLLVYWTDSVDQEDIGWSRNDPQAPPILPYDEDITVFLLTLGVEADLHHYLEYKLAMKPKLLKRRFGRRPILDHLLRPRLLPDSSHRIEVDTVALLLRHGADPNEEFKVLERKAIGFGMYTVWGFFLEFLHITQHARDRTPSLTRDQLEVTKLMIKHGGLADLRPWRNVVMKQFFGWPEIKTNGRVSRNLHPV